MSEVSTVFGFIDLLTGYQPAMVIMAAGRLGLFDALGDNPQSIEELAERLEADPPVLGALLRALAGIGLAAEGSAGFTSTAFVQNHLTHGEDLALVIKKEEYFARAWLSLEDVVRSGEPELDPWRNRLASDPTTAFMFLDALNVLADHTGPQVWELAELAPGKRVLDVGGGFGHYTRRIVEAGSTVVLVDLPQVVAAMGDRLDGLQSGAVELVAADVMTDKSCGVGEASVDAALVSHMLHDLSVDAAIELLRHVHAAIAPGGSIVVNDFAGDTGPGSFGPMFDVMMRVETGGAAHPLGTLRGMMVSAGFGEVAVVDLPEPLTVLTGVKS